MSSLPSFVVAGVPKAGTTTLHSYLRAHPHVYVSKPKELHYFSMPDLHKRSKGPGKLSTLPTVTRTLEAYEQQFVDADPRSPIGEVSPSYLFYPDAHVRMRETLGDDLKIVVLLRNPIDRAFSNWVHLRRTGAERLDFLSSLEAEKERWNNGYADFWCYLRHSTYIPQLDKLFETFPEDQVKLLRFDDLIGDPLRTITDLSEFLGVPAPSEVTESVLNAGGWIPKSRLGRAIERPSKLKFLLRHRLPRPLGELLRSTRERTKQRAAPPELDPRAARYVQERTAADLEEVKQRFCLDLTRSRKFSPTPTD